MRLFNLTIKIVSLDKSETRTIKTEVVAKSFDEALKLAKEAYPYAKKIM